MHFSLRTLLVATTAVAIYMGGSLGLVRTLNVWQGRGGVHSLSYVYLFSDMPMFVLWVIAAVWAFDRSERPGMKALLGGLVLAAAWRFASPLVQAVIFQPIGANWEGAFAAFTIFNALVHTTIWGLLLYALLKAAEPWHAPASPLKVSPPAESRDC
jgi:hypothetical protein